MADAVMHVLTEGIGQEQYEAVNEKLNAQGDPPAGLRFHAAGASDDGRWRIIEVWDSRDQFEQFNEEWARWFENEQPVGQGTLMLPAQRRAGFRVTLGVIAEA